MKQYTILIITFGIIIFLVLGVLYLINNILLKKKKVDFQFGTIIKIINDRIILLEEIFDFIKKDNDNEKKYLKEIKEISIELNEIKIGAKENLNKIKESNKILEKFVNLKNIYPQFAKNKIYNELLEKIELNNQRINYAFDIYDKEVAIYNQQKQTKINLIISKIFKIKDYEYYNK